MESQLSLTIFITLLLLILIEAWRKFNSKNSNKNLPPGPWKLPIIGNMHQLVGSLPHHRLNDLAKKYGPIMHLQLGQISTIVISSPELAEQVMKTHDLIFASRPFTLTARVIFYNRRDIATSPYGEYWRHMRKICTLELLSNKRVQSFRSIREEEVSNLIRLIASCGGAPVNLTKMLMAFTYSITSRTTFGKVRKQTEAFTPVVQKIVCVLGGFSIADLFPSVKLLEVVTGMRSKLQKLHQEADAILEGIIKEHREKNKSENSEADDLVDVLLNLQDNGLLDIPLATEDIKGVILDLFIAGIETSSTAIEWAISEMVKHPNVMEKAQAEIRKVCNGEVDENSIHDLSYLNAVIKETLRFHPPGPLILPRETRQDVEICGYKIPNKTQVIVNAHAIARSQNHWNEPDRFNPERFVESSVDYKGTNFEFIPFGAGRRMCPGIQYGTSVVRIGLANLLYHFDWKIVNGVKPEDFDMSEGFGAAVRRKNDLFLIPTPFK